MVAQCRREGNGPTIRVCDFGNRAKGRTAHSVLSPGFAEENLIQSTDSLILQIRRPSVEYCPQISTKCRHLDSLDQECKYPFALFKT